MLRIKKSHRVDEWIVYDPTCFQTCHTHCKHKRVALKIRYLVSHEIVPTTHDKRFIDSCLRVAKHKRYKEQLQQYLITLKEEKGHGKFTST